MSKKSSVIINSIVTRIINVSGQEKKVLILISLGILKKKSKLKRRYFHHGAALWVCSALTNLSRYAVKVHTITFSQHNNLIKIIEQNQSALALLHYSTPSSGGVLLRLAAYWRYSCALFSIKSTACFRTNLYKKYNLPVYLKIMSTPFLSQKILTYQWFTKLY